MLEAITDNIADMKINAMGTIHAGMESVYMVAILDCMPLATAWSTLHHSNISEADLEALIEVVEDCSLATTM